jgi:predicted transcriptional regulator of viral defense system
MATRKSSKTEQALRLVGQKGMVRPRDLAPFGIEPYHFRRLLQKGQLAQVSRGLYRSVEHEPTPHHRLAEVAKRVPNGVICLLSALYYHQLCTQSPAEVWVAIDRKSHLPSMEDKTVRFVRFSGAALREGVEKHLIEGVPVNITSCSKSVADCFKYRYKTGKDGLNVALEALRTCLRQRKCPPDRLLKCAKICRVESIMHPYLQALSPNP